MYQAFISFRPVTEKVQWLDHTGSTVDEVANKVRSDPALGFKWDSIFIKPVAAKKTGDDR